jgi:hypothetical protein
MPLVHRSARIAASRERGNCETLRKCFAELEAYDGVLVYIRQAQSVNGICRRELPHLGSKVGPHTDVSVDGPLPAAVVVTELEV